MMMNNSLAQLTRLIAFILIALVPSSVWAITAKAIFLGATSDSPKEAYLFVGEKSVKVTLPRRYLSSAFELPDGALSAAILPKPHLLDTPLDPATPMISIPENAKHCLLLFLPDPDNPVMPVRAMMIDATGEHFPNGHSRLFNMCTGAVAAKFGSEEVTIQPGTIEHIKPPVTDSSYRVGIAVRYPKDTKWRVICNSTWVHKPDARQLIFVVPTEGRKYPRVWSVFDQD